MARELIEQLREEEASPAFRYVEKVPGRGRTVVVGLGPGRDPHQVVVGGAQLAWHLYLPRHLSRWGRGGGMPRFSCERTS